MLIVKMEVDCGSMEVAKAKLLNFCGIDTILVLFCVFSLLESMNTLMKFA
jgi:hypothetical protein